MRALSELFDETRLLVPVRDRGAAAGETPLPGHPLTVVPLTARSGTGLASKMSFVPWCLRNGATILRELRSADAVHAPIPGDVGTVGMMLGWLSRKPLFVRHCGNWTKPVTAAERFWRWFMESTAGNRNVMLATGGLPQPPSTRNAKVSWVFSSSLSDAQLKTFGAARSHPFRTQPPAEVSFRLITVARQEKAKGAGEIIRSLPALTTRFPCVSLDIVGDGPAVPEFRQIAEECGVADRVHFTGRLHHTDVMERLKNAAVFVFPTTSSEGFPKAVLEALASGLPVIATPVSVLPHLLATGCGIVIDDASPAAIAEAVEKILASGSTYESMSRQAIATARQYSLESWRDTIGVHLEAAWGSLKAVRT